MEIIDIIDIPIAVLKAMLKDISLERIKVSKAIEIDPKDSFLYFWRGFAYESLEEYPNAVKDLKIAKHLDPGFTLTASILENIETKGF